MNTTLGRQINKNLIRSAKFEFIIVLRIATIFAMLLKTTIFMALLETANADKLVWNNITFKFSLVHLAFIVLLFAFGYLFSNKGK
jgi:hypothetical protein